MRKPELLAPAGDLERLKFACLYGADAVYIGGALFGLRANATNFTIAEIKEGCRYAHSLNKRVYVTVNIALHSKEINDLVSYLKELARIGVDAIIITDPVVLSLAKEHTNLEIHLSTQQSTLNKEACEYWVSAGVKRIVLGRETSREEIKDIISNVNIDIETFIHGAMCASYSGRCVLSNTFTNRDANRGGCAQICRWEFALLNEHKKELKAHNNFTFSCKDLSQAEHIKDMINDGIISFKIEGRMRSVYYIATIVSIYRKIIDDYCNNPLEYEYNINQERVLRACANRDSVSQFFSGNSGPECQYYMGRQELSNQDFLGIVIAYDKTTNIATIEQRNYFSVGDIVEFFGPKTIPFPYKISNIVDVDDCPLEIVRHPKQIVKIKVNNELRQNDIMRIKND